MFRRERDAESVSSPSSETLLSVEEILDLIRKGTSVPLEKMFHDYSFHEKETLDLRDGWSEVLKRAELELLFRCHEKLREIHLEGYKDELPESFPDRLQSIAITTYPPKHLEVKDLDFSSFPNFDPNACPSLSVSLERLNLTNCFRLTDSNLFKNVLRGCNRLVTLRLDGMVSFFFFCQCDRQILLLPSSSAGAVSLTDETLIQIASRLSCLENIFLCRLIKITDRGLISLFSSKNAAKRFRSLHVEDCSNITDASVRQHIVYFLPS